MPSKPHEAVLAANGRDPDAPGAVPFVLIQSRQRATKSYRIDAGRIVSDGGPPLSRGTFHRAVLPGRSPLATLARVLDTLPPAFVLAAGDLVSERDTVSLTVRDRVADGKDAIARTKGWARYHAGRSGLLALDHDAGDLDAAFLARLAAAGGLAGVLATVAPEMARAGVLARPSGSSGIVDKRTGWVCPGGGVHLYLVAKDGGDVQAFAKRLHERLILAGWGWVLVAKNGYPLVRSLIDAVASGDPERLVFEADAALGPGLAYAPGARACRVERDGALLDTAALPALSPDERAELGRIEAKLKAEKEPTAAPIRAEAKQRRTDALIARGVPPGAARERVAQAFEHQRLDSAETVVLDDGRRPRVADILRDPDAYDGATGADPWEPAYGGGRNKARWHASWHRVWCFSHAHGEQRFEAGWSARDLIEAWEARRDPAELARMWPLARLDGTDAERAQLKAAGLPASWAAAQFGVWDKAALDALWRRLSRDETPTPAEYADLAHLPAKDTRRVLASGPFFPDARLALVKAGVARARRDLARRFAPRVARPVPLPAGYRVPVSLDEAQAATRAALAAFGAARDPRPAGSVPLRRRRRGQG